MNTGTQLRLTRTTGALDLIGGKSTYVRIPAETILTMLPGLADGHGMINVLWESRVVKMFAVDIAVRGDEIKRRAAAA